VRFVEEVGDGLVRGVALAGIADQGDPLPRGSSGCPFHSLVIHGGSKLTKAEGLIKEHRERAARRGETSAPARRVETSPPPRPGSVAIRYRR
jgi:hypothetical protein